MSCFSKAKHIAFVVKLHSFLIPRIQLQCGTVQDRLKSDFLDSFQPKDVRINKHGQTRDPRRSSDTFSVSERNSPECAREYGWYRDWLESATCLLWMSGSFLCTPRSREILIDWKIGDYDRSWEWYRTVGEISSHDAILGGLPQHQSARDSTLKTVSKYKL